VGDEPKEKPVGTSDWNQAARDAATDEAFLRQQAALRHAYREPNLALAVCVDQAVGQFLDIVNEYQAAAIHEAMARVRASQTGRPGSSVLDNVAKGNVTVLTFSDRVEWQFANPDLPDDALLTVISTRRWYFWTLRDLTTGAYEDIVFGYDHTGQLQVPEYRPLDETYLSEAMQSMAGFLASQGLPLPT
jgi:hypothetical protein